MAVSIDSDLLKFKEKLSNTQSISDTVTKITSKIEELKTSAKTAVTSLNSNYQGDGLSKAIDAFTSIEAAVDGIKESIPEGPTKAIDMTKELITKIEELEKLKEQIETLEKEISSLSSSSDNNITASINNKKSDSKKSELSTKENEFKTKHDEAKAKLSEIKAINPNIDTQVKVEQVEVDSGTGEIRTELQNLKEGTYNKVVYTGKNGRAITTYIYLPVGASKTSGLPVAVYMGGDGATGHALSEGVGNQLYKGAQYSGIVIVMQAENETPGSYSAKNDKFIETMKEVIDNTVKTYDADSNRISVIGYSWGGSGAQHMIARYPGYFSQAVILGQGTGALHKESCGYDACVQAIANSATKVHIICGTRDTDNIDDLQALYGDLKKYGGSVTCEWRQGATHDGINTQHKITVDGKTYDNYVEFCLAQSKEDNNKS